MSEIEHYEILVIGSGEAGKHLTWNLAQSGHRTAVVKRKYIGGSSMAAVLCADAPPREVLLAEPKGERRAESSNRDSPKRDPRA
jgi:heterodisulfide reductase subunit A-like polyferredoxin